jgi:hypothetical protein
LALEFIETVAEEAHSSSCFLINSVGHDERGQT